MVASTDLKARLFDLVAEVMDLVREDKRDPKAVADVLQRIKDDPNFAENVFKGKDGCLSLTLEDWQRFYKEVFGTYVAVSKFKASSGKEGFNWPIVVAINLTVSQVLNAMRQYIKIWCASNNEYYDALENNRTSTKPYVIFVRDRIEADEELKNFSANQLEEKGIKGITLLERLLLEFIIYWKFEKHLDVKNGNLCSGSRDTNDHVPYVCCHPNYGEVYVLWYDPGYAHDDLRGRETVS